jgi:N-acetylmuramoyl-L-alanine amidase
VAAQVGDKFMKLDPSKVERVVIHTAATPSKAIDISASSIDAYHKSKGWDGIGYHNVVRFDGRVEEGRPWTKQGAHVEGLNSRSVGICFSGNGDLQAFTPEQFKAGVSLTVDMLEHFDLVERCKTNPMTVLGHREVNGIPGVPKTSKTCPGKKVDMRKYRLAVLAEIERRGL